MRQAGRSPTGGLAQWAEDEEQGTGTGAGLVRAAAPGQNVESQQEAGGR